MARKLFITDAVIAVLFGIGLVVVPAALLALYGAADSPTATFLARVLGAAVLGHGAIQWLARDVAETAAGWAITRGNLAFDVVAAIAAALAVLSSAINLLGWGIVVLFAALGAVRLYLITRPRLR